MNKIIKYIAIIFAVALSVGIIGSCVAALAAIVQGVTKDADFRPEDASGAVYHDENGNLVVFGLQIGGTEETVSFTKTFKEEEIRSISVDTGAVDVIIETGDKFEVVAENVPKSYKAEIKDGVLLVYKESRPFFLFSFGFFAPQQKITVTVPEGFVAEKFSVHSGSGRMEITGIHADRLLLDTGSGAVSLSQANSSRAEIDTGSGKVEVLNSSLGVTKVDSGSGAVIFSGIETENFSIDSGSGRVSYEGMMAGNCIFHMGSGSVSIVLNASEQEYSIRADMGSGNFYLNGKKLKDIDIENRQAENALLFDCGSGRVSLEFTKE